MMADLVFDLLVRVTLWLGAVSLVALCLRQASAATRHLVWSVGIVGALAMPVLVSTPGLPLWPTATATARLSDTPRSPAATPSGARFAPPDPVVEPSQSSATVTRPLLAATNKTTAAPPQATPPTADLAAWSRLWCSAWIIGSAALALHLLFALWKVACTIRTATSAPASLLAAVDTIRRDVSPNLRISTRLAPSGGSAWAFGSKLLLPVQATTWSADRLRSVVIHELAHIRRRDWLTNLAGRALRIACWFHPLVWLATAQMRKEQEQACDDAVIRSGILPSSYAEDLTAIASRNATGLVASLATPIARHHELVHRVRYLLTDRDRAPSSAWVSPTLLTTALTLVVLTGTSQRAEAQPIPDDSDALSISTNAGSRYPERTAKPTQDPKLDFKSRSAELGRILRLRRRERRTALSEFTALGAAAIPHLELHARDEDPEIAERAVASLEKVRGAENELVAATLRLFAELDSNRLAHSFWNVFRRNLHRPLCAMRSRVPRQTSCIESQSLRCCAIRAGTQTIGCSLGTWTIPRRPTQPTSPAQSI